MTRPQITRLRRAVGSASSRRRARSTEPLRGHRPAITLTSANEEELRRHRGCTSLRRTTPKVCWPASLTLPRSALLAFGLPFSGSTGGKSLNKPVVGMAFDPTTGGYLEVASDGELFSFTAAFYGSMGGRPLSAPVVSMQLG